MNSDRKEVEISLFIFSRLAKTLKRDTIRVSLFLLYDKRPQTPGKMENKGKETINEFTMQEKIDNSVLSLTKKLFKFATDNDAEGFIKFCDKKFDRDAERLKTFM